MTPSAGSRKQLENYRAMSDTERSQLGAELFELGLEMVRCAVRQQHPDWGVQQQAEEVSRRFRLAERIHSAVRKAEPQSFVPVPVPVPDHTVMAAS